MPSIDPTFLQKLEAEFHQALAAKDVGDLATAVRHYEQALELSLAELARAGLERGDMTEAEVFAGDGGAARLVSGIAPPPPAVAPPISTAALQVAAPRRLRFMHIPKTAGSTFQDCLSRLYPGESFTFKGDWGSDLSQWRALSTERQRGLRLVAGHAPRITRLHEVDALPTLTFLREPLARMRSYCQHVSEGKSTCLLDRFPPEHFDLDAFIASDDNELDNLQTRYLLGVGDLAPDVVDPAAAKRAFEVLADLTTFGLVERFDESLMLFRRQLGWTDWPVYQRLNVKGDRRRLSFEAHHLDVLRRRNAVDLALYALAVPLFEQRLAAGVPDLMEQLAEFEMHQALFARVWQAAMAEGSTQ